MRLRLLLVAYFALGSTGALADDVEADDVDMHVKPLLCITTLRATSCAMDFLVTWRSAGAGDYCLHSSLVDDALKCWADRSAGDHADPRTIAESFDYWMAAEAGGDPLASVAVKVVSAESSDRRRNRRKRHVWSVW